jgi:hypothetical protein
MADPDPKAGKGEVHDSSLTESGSVRTREVVVVRRRRSTRYRSHHWVAKLSTRRWLPIAGFSAIVMLLMAAALYFGLSRE